MIYVPITNLPLPIVHVRPKEENAAKLAFNACRKEKLSLLRSISRIKSKLEFIRMQGDSRDWEAMPIYQEMLDECDKAIKPYLKH